MKQKIAKWILVFGGLFLSLGLLQANELDLSGFNPNEMGEVPAESQAIDSVQILVVEQKPGTGFVRFKTCKQCEYRGLSYDASTVFEDAAGSRLPIEKLKEFSGENAMLGFRDGEKVLRQIRLSERESGGES